MMGGYCPAGKVDCKYYFAEGCHGLLYLFCGTTKIEGYEQCPWPSRQVPVAPPSNHDEAIMGIVDLVEYDSPLVKNFTIIPARAIMDKVYAAGFAAALQQCREEVGKQKIVGGYNCGPTISRDDLLAAISKVEEEIK